MYSASLPSYNNYNRGRAILVTACVNILFLTLILMTAGSMFGKLFEEKHQPHAVSIKAFNIISHNEKTEDSQQNPIVVPQQPKQIIKEKTPAKKIEKIKKTPLKTPSKVQEKSMPTKKNETQTKKNNAENSQAQQEIATDATHFGMQNPEPQYPMIAFQNNESGSVTIEYIVSAEGLIKEAKIIESSGFTRLDRTALASFKKWKFKPAIGITGALLDSLPKKITFVFDIKTQTITAE
jgi:TonB family protein